MNKLRIPLIALILLLLMPVEARGQNIENVVVVTINTANLEDFLGNGCLYNLARNGSIGLMNTRSNGSTSQYKPYLTLGSGEKSEVYYDCIESYKADAEVKKYYEKITLNTCTEGNIVNPSINRLITVNSKTLYNSEPGKLGNLLRGQGYKTSFIGGFWYDNSKKSPAFFIGMDKTGIVDNGEIEDVFTDGQIDSDKLINAYNKLKLVSDFMVIELGDLESLYANKRMFSEASYAANKHEIIEKSGEIIDAIVKNTDFSNTVLILISPYSKYEFGQQNELLSPVIIYDGGKTRGIISSKTTRRAGIVSSLDFAPYILDCFNMDYSGFTGYSYEFQTMDDNIEYISSLNKNTVSTAKSRIPALKGFALFILSTLLLYIVKLLKNPARLTHITRFLMELALYIPFFMLIEGGLRLDSVFSKVLFILLSGIAFTILVDKVIKKTSDRILAAAAVNIIGLVADIISGMNMLQYSILSYDLIIGARYYGLGNEFSGVLIGCSLVLFGYILGRDKKYLKFVLFLMIFISILIGLPWFGANTGCFITAVFTFMVFILLEKGYSIKNAIKLSIVISMASILFVILVNLIFKDSESHLGKLISQTNTQGISYFTNIILRKFSMALRLLKSNIWSSVFIGFIIASTIVFVKPFKYIKDKIIYFSSIRNLWVAAIFACITAIAVNDSGIVTSAFIMLYCFFSLGVMYFGI